MISFHLIIDINPNLASGRYLLHIASLLRIPEPRLQLAVCQAALICPLIE